jgi:hypothetical protein
MSYEDVLQSLFGMRLRALSCEGKCAVDAIPSAVFGSLQFISVE